MKKVLIIGLMLAGGLGLGSAALAQTDFDLSVTIPSSDSASFVLWKLIEGNPFPTTPETGTDMNFAVTLTDVGDGDKVFLGDHYYAVDVAPNGAGQLNVSIDFQETGNPVGVASGNGLAIKGIATVVKAKADNTEETLYREALQDIDNVTVSKATLTTAPVGFMRMYVGLATGYKQAQVNPTDPLPEPAASQPFTPADIPGLYTGTITLTATP